MWDSKVHSPCSTPQGDNVAKTKEDDTETVDELGALRSVTEGTNQNDKDQSNVELQDDFKDIGANALRDEVKRVGLGGGSRR